MNPPSEDIKDLIEVESSVTLVFGTDLFVGEMPEAIDGSIPDLCVVIRDVAGLPPGVEATLEYPMVHITVRGARGGYRAAQILAQQLRDIVHGTVNTTVNSARYIDIRCESDVGFIGVDERNRPKFTSSYSIKRTTV